MIKLHTLVEKNIKTGNVSNIITRIILKMLRKTDKTISLGKLEQDLQGEFKKLFKGVVIQVHQNRKIPGNIKASTTDTDQIIIRLDKEFVNQFRMGNRGAIDELRRELLTQMEHEVTHIIQHRKYPQSREYMKSYDKFKKKSDKYFKKYGKDYTEIEAHARQLIKLAQDYKLPIETAIKYYAGVFRVDWKKLYKKLFRLGAFDKKYWSKYPGKIEKV